MTRAGRLTALLLAPLATAGSFSAALAADASRPAAPPSESAPTPAQWRSWDLLVDLQDLPRAYTCNELWYRFHDLLLALGARPDMRILTYHCGTTAAASTRSPSVQLQFALPNELSAADARYADLSAVRTTVRLEPGDPHSLKADDCELLKQINATLLPALPVHVLGPDVTCRAPAKSGSRPGFVLRVQALVPRS
jgi:hypothetical protein